MQNISGNILTGGFDEEGKVFTIETVKNFYTETTLKEHQVQSLCKYLSEHQDEDGQVVSLFDQMLIRLSQSEVQLLLTDLERIRLMYH
ncbi:hypothetical protein SAMN05192533_10186 [Mesobacillus persicus]|uniref:Uncharacterized protein n=1 Tax=Mesobacillus persicus TaxID=930146 RepID=A0A1H7VS40_9BACI|nr:hypothetical protein [Mesobacillus persicus]SEM12036.1 hypothetical protein SAMN05192533_10186 [Mesobacillus persicus]